MLSHFASSGSDPGVLPVQNGILHNTDTYTYYSTQYFIGDTPTVRLLPPLLGRLTRQGLSSITTFPCALLLFFIAACSVIAVRQISGSLAGKTSQGAGNWHAAPQNSIMGDFWWMQSLKGTKLSLDSVSNSTFGRHRPISFDNVFETGNQR